MTLPRTPETAKKVKMEEVKALVHQRGQVKGSVTTIVRALEKAEDDPSQVSLPILRVYSKKLESFYNTYVSLHKEILACTPSGKLDEQDEKLSEFEDLHTDALIRVEILIEAITKPLSATVPTLSQQNSPQVIVQQQPLRAPIPTFDGRYENWPRFKMMFQDIVDKCSDSDAIKLHHLDKALVGSAAGIIDAKTLADNSCVQRAARTWLQPLASQLLVFIEPLQPTSSRSGLCSLSRVQPTPSRSKQVGS